MDVGLTLSIVDTGELRGTEVDEVKILPAWETEAG
jgi:hypothetical protein